MKYYIFRMRNIFLIILFGVLAIGTIIASDTKEAENLFTPEERYYISQSSNLSVGLTPNRFVMSYYDDDEGFGGLNFEIMEALSRISGLSFSYVPLLKEKTRAESLIDGDYDLAIAFFDYAKINNSEAMYFSESFMENSFELIMKTPNAFPLNSHFTIAVPLSAASLQEFIKTEYPLAEIIYTPADERVEYVFKNIVDATIIGRHEANYILQMPRYRLLSSYPTNIVLGENSIGMSSRQDKILVDILNKSINYMMENEFSRILTESTVMRPYEYTFTDFLMNRIETILITILFLSTILLILFRLRNKKIKHLKESAEKANQAKTEFISRMSHDMRTPLGAIINLTEFGMDETLEPATSVYFKQIKHNSEYLLALVNDVLDIHRMEEGNIIQDEKPLKFREFITKVNEIVAQLADKQDISYQTFISDDLLNTILLIDQIQSEKILINLLTNAVKYTPKGGSVTLSAKILFEDELSLKLSYKIKDTGIGMSEAFQAKMYEPFEIEQASPQGHSIGIGLGLAITKHLVENMGGTITCISKQSEGTCFSLEIIYKKVSKDSLPFESNIKNNCILNLLTGKQVLVCEDNRMNQIIITKLLTDKGCKVDIADNGAIGVSMAEESTYDVIIMDIRMPIMDGYTATSKIKAGNKNIPIIGLSADAYPDDLKKGSSSQLDAYICKPIERDIFYTTICEALQKE